MSNKKTVAGVRRAQKLVNSIRSMKEKSDEFLKNRLFRWFKKNKKATKPRYSFIAAVYNVEKYLDEYFESLTIQRGFRRNVQVIMVDDGSTDDSAAIIAKWAKRYSNIEYYYKPNGGQASARNLGIEKAKGTWVTFMDPDDFISADYLKIVDGVLDSRLTNVVLISTNLVFFHEKTGTIKRNHPLSFRYRDKMTVKSISDMGSFCQLSASHAFFRRSNIITFHVRFDERVKPNFEDAKYVAQYMLHARGNIAVFLKDAEYFYRKRSDSSSSLDNSSSDIRLFSDVIEHGMIDVLKYSVGIIGHIPVWLQRTCLYSIIWTIRGIYNKSINEGTLNDHQKMKFFSLLSELFLFIDEDVIWDFELAYISELDKVALTNLFKSGYRERDCAWINGVEHDHRKLSLTYNHFQPISEFKLVTERGDVWPISKKTLTKSIGNRHYAYHSRFLFDLTSVNSISVICDGKMIELAGVAGLPSEDIWVPRLIRKLSNVTINDQSFPKAHRKNRVRANLLKFVSQYKGAWVFMDRDTQADDNAEHFYRFVTRNHPELKCYFILNEDSADWSRLLDEGFTMIPFGSEDHFMATLHCEYLISSHYDHYIFGYPDQRYYKDYLGARKFVFLQHGVIINDLSNWLNQKDGTHLIITSTHGEYDALAGDMQGYAIASENVALTGMPRLDALLDQKPASIDRVIVAPTWRSYIVGEVAGTGNMRHINPEFTESKFFNHWNGLLSSSEFAELLNKSERKLTLLLHPNLQPYSDLFTLPEGSEVAYYGGQSIQPLIAEAAMLITDYSSIAFDAAYLDRPILYYQFDEEEFFSKGLWRRGYFDYRIDGFGPVVTNFNDAVRELSTLLNPKSGLQERYRERIRQAFTDRDGNCCQRVFDAIIARNPKHVDSETTAISAGEGKGHGSS